MRLKFRLKTLLVGAALVAVLAVPAVASADSCSNLSMPAPKHVSTTSGPVTRGNWVWLPSLGIPDPAWGFSPPGTADSQAGVVSASGLPDQHGNYTNGYSSSLLGHSAYCTKGVNQNKSHGIVSGCQ